MKLHRKSGKIFTGNEDHLTDLPNAIGYITNGQKYNDNTAYESCFFSKAVVEDLLNLPTSVGIRYYYAKIAENTLALSLNAVASNRDDLIEIPDSVILSVRHPVYFNEMIHPELSDYFKPLDEICSYTAEYRAKSTGQPKGGFFGQREVRNVLNEPGCVGIRCYFGSDSEKCRVIVIVGVDARGNDLFTGYIIQMSALCPPHCGFENQLNSNKYYNTELMNGQLHLPATVIKQVVL